METFIVLGLCFILYEALDLFQSCYNNTSNQQPQTQPQQPPQTTSDGSSGDTNECNSSSSSSVDHIDNDTLTENKDTLHTIVLDTNIDDNNDDDDDNDVIANASTPYSTNKVFSICDRVNVNGQCHRADVHNIAA